MTAKAISHESSANHIENRLQNNNAFGTCAFAYMTRVSRLSLWYQGCVVTIQGQITARSKVTPMV